MRKFKSKGKMNISQSTVSTRILLAFAFSLLTFTHSSLLHAEEWYLPRPVNVLKKGSLELGTNLTFAFDRNGLEFDRNVQGSMSLRYSPFNRFEFYTEMPYTYIEQERVKFPNYIYSEGQQGWSDLYARISYDAFGKYDWKIILSVDASFPTGKNPYKHNRSLGSGFYSIAPGITAMKIIDPVVLFLYLGHQWTIEETFQEFGKVGPGEDFRFRVGTSIMMNPRVRMNLFTAGNITGHTKLNGIQIAGTDQDVLRFGGGLSWDVSDRFRIDWNALFGATDNAQDAILSLELTHKL